MTMLAATRFILNFVFFVPFVVNSLEFVLHAFAEIL